MVNAKGEKKATKAPPEDGGDDILSSRKMSDGFVWQIISARATLS